jgi:hypothetical protein
MSKETYLDLDRVIIFGRENYKSDLVIDSIIKGIEAGDEFPAVQVRERTDGNYEILDGHRRVVAFYIAHKPLKVTILKGKCEPKMPFDLRQTILIYDKLINDQGTYVDDRGISHIHIASYRWLKEIDPRYR